LLFNGHYIIQYSSGDAVDTLVEIAS